MAFYMFTSREVIGSLPLSELKLKMLSWNRLSLSLDSADAVVGGAIGLLFAYICYRQHYPPFLHMDSHLPYASLAAAAQPAPHPQDDPQPTDNATTLPLEGLTEGPVWLVAPLETPPRTHSKPVSPPPIPND